MVAQVDDPVRVPLVAEDEHRDEGERDEHRRRSQPPRRGEDRGRGGQRRDQDARPGQDAAQAAPFAARLQPAVGLRGAQAQADRPGQDEVAFLGEQLDSQLVAAGRRDARRRGRGRPSRR